MFLNRSVSLFLLVFSNVLLASEPGFNDRTMLPPINVSNVVQKVLSEHPRALIAHEQAQLAELEAASAKSDLLPNINANYNHATYHNPLSLGRGHAQIGLGSVGLGQALFDLPALFSYQSAKKRLLAATLMSEDSDLKVAGTAISSYMDLLIIRINLDLATEYYDFLEDIKKEITNGSLKGKFTAADIGRVEADFERAKKIKHGWKGKKTKAGNAFERDTLFLAKDYFLVEPSPLEAPESVELALDLAAQNNPVLAAARARIESSDKDLLAAKARRLPRIEASISGHAIDRGHGDFKGLHMNGAAIGVNVTIPIFNRRRNTAIAIEKIRRNMTERQLQEAQLRLNADVKDIYADSHELRTELEGLCNSLTARMKTVDDIRTNLGTKYGVTDLLFEKIELYNTAVDLNDHILSGVLYNYNLHVQTGTLLEQLPPPVESTRAPIANPQAIGRDAYTRLSERCQKL